MSTTDTFLPVQVLRNGGFMPAVFLDEINAVALELRNAVVAAFEQVGVIRPRLRPRAGYSGLTRALRPIYAALRDPTRRQPICRFIRA
jgi:hypothetical protein